MMWAQCRKNRRAPKRGQRAVHYGQRPHSGAKWILHSPRSTLGRQGSEVHSKEWYGVVSLGMAWLGRAWLSKAGHVAFALKTRKKIQTTIEGRRRAAFYFAR